MNPEAQREGSSDSSSNLLGQTVLLLDRARSGDGTACGELLDLYRDRLLGFLKSRLGASQRRVLDTMDLVQEVMVKTLSSLDRFEHRGPGSFWAYLRMIALNEVRTIWRRDQFRPAPKSISDDSAHAPVARGPSVLSGMVSREACEAFESAIEKLDTRVKEALLLRLELSLDYAAIAASCGFPSEDAARMAIRRALTKVAQEMAAHDLD